MSDLGGLGGVVGGRALDPENLFEAALERSMGAAMRADPEGVCPTVWGALVNCEWRHDGGHTASLSFRRAGDLIAAILGEGEYMDWYCSGPAGEEDPATSAAMRAEGWIWGDGR